MAAALDPSERLLRACRGEPVDRPPVWLMRQAGRYLPEYRALRAGRSFLEMCRDVERAVAVSLQPLQLIGSEAVVFFCDIFVPVPAMGVALDFAPGPVIAEPIRSRAQVEALALPDPRESVPFVFEILRRLRRELSAARIPLIGFAGAPFTLAAYLVEGRGDPTRRYPQVQRMLAEQPDTFQLLLQQLCQMTSAYLAAQIEAGAQVVQLFDSWAGALDEATYRRLLLPVNRSIARHLRQPGQPDRARAPLILYTNDAPHLVDAMLDTGADAISVGAAVNLASAARRAGRRASVQGNLDPAALALPRAQIFERVRALAQAAAPARGHILNLGSGCTPDTPAAGARAFTDAARALADS